MIDFLNPKSKKVKGLILGLLTIALVGLGIYFVFTPLKPLISGVDKQMSILPGDIDISNLEDIELDDLHLPQNKIVNRQPITSAKATTENNNNTPQPTNDTKVLGVSYNKEAVKQLAPKTSNFNRIVIPRMGVDTTILEGKTADTLLKGVWHMPMGSTPNKNGNTIITAHRYLHRPPSPKTFYLIDKMEIGDNIIVYWEGQKIEYEVTGTKIVNPDQIEILNNTSHKQLTLFSCTPLFTSKQRLVVTAEPI